MMHSLSLTQPDDWHLHVRDGAALADVVKHSAAQFARAIIMPNLVPPVTSIEQALAYRERILEALASRSTFEPLMTLYLTDNTSKHTVKLAAACEHVHAFKLYPAGATTHSDAGVSDITNVYDVLEAMQTLSVPLLIHGEVVGADVDVFDRETKFIEQQLTTIVERFPALKVVLEHITTREGVEFVSSAGASVAATITAHHLLINRNALFAGGMRPHHYCLPVAKRECHRRALLAAATGGDPSFFLGTDSAPHPRSAKESACGCAGIYTANNALGLYAEAFEAAGSLHKLEAFASFHGPDFYALPRNQQHITLLKDPAPVPDTLTFADDELVPFRAGAEIAWRLADEEQF